MAPLPEPFYQPQAASETGIPQSHIRDELKTRLVPLGMVQVVPKTAEDRRQYYARTTSPLFILVIVSLLLGGGQVALEKALSGDIGAGDALWLAGIAAYTFPVVVGLVLIYLVVDSDMPSQAKIVALPLIVSGVGYVAASITQNVVAINLANTMTCSGGGPVGLAFCYGARGLFMLFQSFTWQFTLSGLIQGCLAMEIG